MKQKIAFAMIMGIITTGIISFLLISINIGYSEKFVGIWTKNWGIAYVVAVPAILVIAPRIQKLVDSFFQK